MIVKAETQTTREIHSTEELQQIMQLMESLGSDLQQQLKAPFLDIAPEAEGPFLTTRLSNSSSSNSKG